MERRATTFRICRALAKPTVPPTARDNCNWERSSSSEHQSNLDHGRRSLAGQTTACDRSFTAGRSEFNLRGATNPFLEKTALSYTLELQILFARSVRMNSRAGVLASRVKNEE